MSEDTDTIWMLREAGKPTGFTPNEASVAEFAKSLEMNGWLHRSERGPVWELTPAGRKELARLDREQCSEQKRVIGDVRSLLPVNGTHSRSKRRKHA